MIPFRTQAQLIEDPSHYQIERIRRLQTRAEREHTGLYYIEGMRFVARALSQGAPIEALVACPHLQTHPFARHLTRREQRSGTPILTVTPAVMCGLGSVEDPQGIGAVVRQRWTSLERIRPANAPCWVMLETMRSSGNLGTILRTADATGGSGLILLGNAIDPYDPATVRATMGAQFEQRFVRTSVDELRVWHGRRHFTLVGTAPAAATDYQKVDFRGPTMLLLGDERKGLSRELQALCDTTIRIPMVGGTDSLNVSVAAGVLLYEVFNQRRWLRVAAHGARWQGPHPSRGTSRGEDVARPSGGW